ncbi:dockerin type I domain-containing protein [Lacipirellula sp.]|uniref:dockerin type I domain-containing protein n=1 Tax=Lacipirellula sp. TaxID=2691419 RepID=UPI003D0BCEA2
MSATILRRPRVVELLLVLAALAVSRNTANAQLCVFLTGPSYLQDFNTLPASGTANNSNSLPQGWAFSEAGTGGTLTYTADNGALSTGNTYSYGASGNSDRAFGELTSGTVNATLGACFLNNTGLVITSFTIAYTGEMWRLGAADAIVDRLDFEFSANATSIVDQGPGVVWTAVNTLDFVSPNNTAPAGAKDGNLAANRTTTAPIAVIPPGGIPAGGVFYIRWLANANIGGTNDGLAIDDFKLNINPSADFNQDRAVDGKDFLALQRGLGTASGASITNGDANRDGAVNFLDLVIWKSQFGAIPPAVPVAQSIPESASLSLALVALATAISRTRPLQSATRLKE